MAKFYLKVIKNIVVIGLFVLLVSAIVFVPLAEYGRWAYFAAGLACGLGVAILNFIITFKLTDAVSGNKNHGIAYVMPFMKMIIYAIVMFTAVYLFGFEGVLGAAAGCLAGPVAILLKNLTDKVAHKLRSVVGSSTSDSDESAEDREYIYENHIRSENGALRYVFIKGHHMERLSGGRSYVTHRRFRKLREIRVKKSPDSVRSTAEV